MLQVWPLAQLANDQFTHDADATRLLSVNCRRCELAMMKLTAVVVSVLPLGSFICGPRHGPRLDLMPPLQSSGVQSPSVDTSSSAAAASQSNLPLSAVWLSADSTLIKRIPRSARYFCAFHLASVFDAQGCFYF